ncbi:hypothetical protein ACWEKT_39425 [Nocardia takedensis]
MSADGVARRPVRRQRPVAYPVLAAGPLRELKAELEGLHRAVGQPTMEQIRSRIEKLADGDEESDPSATPSVDTIHKVLTAPTLPASVHSTVAVAAGLVFFHQVAGQAPVVRGNPRIERIRDLWAAASVARPPLGARPVQQWDPILLGVHRPIEVPGAVGQLPTYIPRAIDADVDRFLDRAAQAGGFVLMVGSSSVGKSRSAWEGLQRRLPDWWLVRPSDRTDLEDLMAEVSVRSIVWLDNLDRYLDRGRLDEIILGRWQQRNEPVVVVGTIWEETYREYLPIGSSQSDPYRIHRAVCELASIVQVPHQLSDEELRDAADRATGDARLATALGVRDYGLVQTLAAAPALIQRWDMAGPFGQAVIAAAVDARRIGVSGPLPTDYLRAAATGYLEPEHRRHARSDSFDEAMRYCTELLFGATAALPSVPADALGEIAGYTVADYLEQHVRHALDRVLVPSETWNAVHGYITVTEDLERAGRSAEGRLLFSVADTLYRQAGALLDAAKLRAKRGYPQQAQDLLRAALDSGDESAMSWMAAQVSPDQAIPLLKRLIDSTPGRNLDHIRGLAGALVTTGADTEALPLCRELVAADGKNTFWALGKIIRILTATKDIEDMVAYLLDCAATGKHSAVQRVYEVLSDLGRLNEMEDVLRSTGSNHYLVKLLESNDRFEEIDAMAESGNDAARSAAIDRTITTNGIDAAIDRVRSWRHSVDDTDSQWRLLHLYQMAGRVDEALELAAEMEDGTPNNDVGVGRILLAANRIDDLRRRADNEDPYAQRELTAWLIQNGHWQEVLHRAQAGQVAAVRAATDWLAAQDRQTEAIPLWENIFEGSGDIYAAHELIDLLATNGRTDKALALARQQAQNGYRSSKRKFAALLAGSGERYEAELRDLIKAGDRYATAALTNLLATRGDIAEIRRWAVAGNDIAARALTSLACERRRTATDDNDPLQQILRTGLLPTAEFPNGDDSIF